ncbi:MAG: hypothetical protein ACLP8B_10270 [Xanthobacteraceae bacterium]
MLPTNGAPTALRAMTAAAAIASVIASAPADARGGGRGWGGLGGGGWHGGFGQGGFPQAGSGTYGGWRGANGASAFSQDRKHSENPHVKAALEEEERVLKKLNSICRGC